MSTNIFYLFVRIFYMRNTINKGDFKVDLSEAIRIRIKNLIEERNLNVSKLSTIHDWSKAQAIQLFEIAIQNSQIYSILSDEDIKQFYKKLAWKHKLETEAYLKLMKKIE